jgi:hypothetical protein
MLPHQSMTNFSSSVATLVFNCRRNKVGETTIRKFGDLKESHVERWGISELTKQCALTLWILMTFYKFIKFLQCIDDSVTYSVSFCHVFGKFYFFIALVIEWLSSIIYFSRSLIEILCGIRLLIEVDFRRHYRQLIVHYRTMNRRCPET